MIRKTDVPRGELRSVTYIAIVSLMFYLVITNATAQSQNREKGGPIGSSASATGAAVANAPQYDIVIRNGRVMDPATGFDHETNVGIQGNRIEIVTDSPISGRRVLDATGKIVAPGFVDILADGFTREGSLYKVMDGVTTQLGMECGPVDIRGEYSRMANEGMMTNYGMTVGHTDIRKVLGLDPYARASAAQIQEMIQMARRGIEDGAIGIGFCVEYVPGTSQAEVLELFRLAAEMRVPCHLHIRYVGPIPPKNDLTAIQEVIADAAVTGASAQIVHISASAAFDLQLALELIAGARAHGVDVMADAYPWSAGSTEVNSPVFDPGWQDRMHITYSDLELVSTGERLTKETFEKYRRSREPVVIITHFIPAEVTLEAMMSPVVMLGTDGGISEGHGHPRGAGSYGKLFREFVREGKQLSLMDALRKTSYTPAQRVVEAAPAMRRKGRLSAGADADIVVFDLNRVRERATYEKPAAYSEGFDYVLVNGSIAVDNGKLNLDLRPGRSVRGAED
jgi:N-acyl-D-aspartate/D-glutamate deacylase